MSKLLYRSAFVIALLIAGLAGVLLFEQARVVEAADCSSPCKKYNQWDGGTAGAQEKIAMGYNDTACYTGCNWVQKGMWVKNNSTGNYIFVGSEKTQTAQRYLYTLYKPSYSSNIQYYYIGYFGSRSTEAQVFVYKYGFEQRVSLAAFEDSTQTIAYGQQTLITDTLWDMIQTGTRISAISGAADVNWFKTWYHNWMCWTCQPGGQWHTQTNDGYFAWQGNASRMYHSWIVLPHESGSLGGTYEAWCDSPSCP